MAAGGRGAQQPRVLRRPAPVGWRNALSLFRPALLQPDFRTQKSSRWRLTQALVKPDIDSPGLASNARGPLTLRCWAGTRAAKSLSNVQEGGSDRRRLSGPIA
jgi:hypothetical protein